MMQPPTMDELERIISTLSKNLGTWKGNAEYRRILEVELFCVMVYRDKFVSTFTVSEALRTDDEAAP